MESVVTRILRIPVLLATPVLVFIAFDIKPLFGLLLGTRWAAAGVFAAILAWIGYLNFLTGWLDRLFDVQGRQRLSLILAALGNGSSIGGLFAALWITRNTILAVSVFAGLQVFYIASWLTVAYCIAKFSLRSLALLVKDGAFTGALAFVAIGAIHLLLPLWFAVIISGAAVFLMDCVYFVKYVPAV
jgi:O-antigen/teichoic acid export membrane protein